MINEINREAAAEHFARPSPPVALNSSEGQQRPSQPLPFSEEIERERTLATLRKRAADRQDEDWRYLAERIGKIARQRDEALESAGRWERRHESMCAALAVTVVAASAVILWLAVWR